MTIGQDATRLAAQLFPRWSKDLAGNPELAKCWADQIDRFARLGLSTAQIEAVVRAHRAERSGVYPDLKTIVGRLANIHREQTAPVQTRKAADWSPDNLPDPLWPDDLQREYLQGRREGLKLSEMMVRLEPIVQKYGGWLVIASGKFEQETWNG